MSTNLGMDPPQTSSRPLEACNTCRKRKVKCDRQRPICAPCGKSRMECSYTDRVKVLKTPRRKPTRAKQFEERLQKVESLLKLPVAVLEKMIKEGDMKNGLDHSTESAPNEAEASILGSNPSQLGIDLATQHMESFAIAPWSRGGKGVEDFSITPSDQPIQESDHSTDTTDTGSVVRQSNTHDSPRVFKSLPPKDEAISLLELYFAKFNNVFPLHHQENFMQLVQTRYSTEYDGDVGWWGNLNMVLAHGCRIRTLQVQAAIEDDEESWGYLENALSVVPFLATQTPSISSIQALVGMAIFLQATPVPRSYSLLVANAIRLGHSIGLHRQDSYHSGMAFAEIEQRKRVFWICYILDKDISMRSGQPPCQHDDDIDVDFPSDSLSDAVGYIFLAPGLWPMNFFRLRIELAVIQGAIYKNLYSAKATRQSDEYRAAVVQDLDERLKLWKSSTSIDFQPEFLTQKLQDQFGILHIVILYFTYFNCLTLIHRSSFQNMSWRTRAPNSIEPFNPRNFSSKPNVIETARCALTLLKLIPTGNYSCLWLILQFSCSAMITLLRNIYLNPTLPNALPDFELVDPMLGMFCKLASRHVIACSKTTCEDGNRLERSGIIIELMRMRDFCFVLKDRAKDALEMAMIRDSDTNDLGTVRPSIEFLVHHGEVAAQQLSSSNNKSSLPFTEAFGASTTTPIGAAAAENSIQHNLSFTDGTSSTHVVPTGLQEMHHFQHIPSHSQDASKSHNIFGDSAEGNINHTVVDSRELTAQEKAGLWNWWDMIEMDNEGNTNIV